MLSYEANDNMLIVELLAVKTSQLTSQVTTGFVAGGHLVTELCMRVHSLYSRVFASNTVQSALPPSPQSYSETLH